MDSGENASPLNSDEIQIRHNENVIDKNEDNSQFPHTSTLLQKYYQPNERRFETPILPEASIVGTGPLVSSAARLLLLFAQMNYVKLNKAEVAAQFQQAIQQFELDAQIAGAPADQVASAKYALAATGDELLQNSSNGDQQTPTPQRLLERFFGEQTGGLRFFRILERAERDPIVNLGLLEIMHVCLSLGFEGVHRAPGGGEELQIARRRLCDAISRVNPAPEQGFLRRRTIQASPPIWGRIEAPVWAVAAIAGVVLASTYLHLRNTLSEKIDTLAMTTAQAYPDTEMTIARDTAVKPPPDPPRTSTQLERIRAALAGEILAGKVDPGQSATTTYIRIGSSVLFPSGGAKVNDAFAPIANKIAAALDKEPGAIQVDGYTDSDPIHTLAFPSNFELSEARAKSVARILQPALSDPQRLMVSGKGADNPVAPNDIEENKSKNRRVEISIPRAD